MNYNLVLHVDSDAPEILSLAFSNAANYRAALPNEDFRMVLVANGPAVKRFTREDRELAEQGEKLAGQGLEIMLWQQRAEQVRHRPRTSVEQRFCCSRRSGGTGAPPAGRIRIHQAVSIPLGQPSREHVRLGTPQSIS